ncbi:MAG: protein-glutamate O-methyltransferase CheR [Thermodesulfobacteriota bacterium]
MFDYGLDLSDREFQAFSELVHAKAGINLHSGKKELVRARLAKRIREGGFAGFDDYYQYVIEDDSGEELILLLDAISTNLTSFFRESQHFTFMIERFLPELAQARAKKNDRRLRIWSAGCSTGEEPYSIAIVILEHSPYFAAGDVRILATDLSTKVLAEAHQAVYQANRMTDVPQLLLRKYFQKGQGRWSGWYRVKNTVRRLVAFKRLNFIQPFPFRRPFDLIFCRNVMIYFDKKMQAELVAKLHQALNEGGYLFIGHSESLGGFNNLFKYIQPTIYRK